MLDALEEHMPEGVNGPTRRAVCSCGSTLREDLSTVDMFQEAIDQKVAFVPGFSFFPCGGGENTMRLNFSNSTPEQINEGIGRLSMVVKEHMTHVHSDNSNGASFQTSLKTKTDYIIVVARFFAGIL